MSTTWERRLLWAVLLGAGALYAWFHPDLLTTRPPGELLAPHVQFSAPRGGLAPWLLLAGAVAGGACVAALAKGIAPRVVAGGLGGYACLVVAGHLLGGVGWLLRRPLFRPDLWAGVVWIGVAALASVAWRRAARSPRAEVSAERIGRPVWGDLLGGWLLVPGVAVAGCYLHALARTQRGGPRGWDVHSCHMPVALEWIRTCSLTEPLERLVSFGTDGVWRFANPGNGHLLLSVPLTLGWELSASLIQLPFAALAAWAAAALARAAGASRTGRLVAGLAFLSAPLVIEQATVAMLDLATAALTLAAVALLLPAIGDDRAPTGALKLAGLSLGLALGTKSTALAHLVFPVAVIASSRWARRPGNWKCLAPFGLLVLLPTLFWYTRSAVLLGNPIFPVGLRLFGWTFADGMTAEDMSGNWESARMGMGSRWEWALFPFRDPGFWEETGFGALFVSIAVPATLAALLILARCLRERRLGGRECLALLAVLGFGVFWFAAARTPRFNLPLLAFLAALGGRVADTLAAGGGRRALGPALATASALTLVLSLQYHGWGMGEPVPRSERLTGDLPAVPVALDGLPPLVIFNDTQADSSSVASDYSLFGADYRHLVYDHPDLPVDDPVEYLARLRRLGATAVFLRTATGTPAPARFQSRDLVPWLRFEGREYASTLYSLRE